MSIQERICNDLTQKQKSSRDGDLRQLDHALQQEEVKLQQSAEKQKQASIRAMKDKHAAEIAARPDLTDQQLKEVRYQEESSLWISSFMICCTVKCDCR